LRFLAEQEPRTIARKNFLCVGTSFTEALDHS
jgi:hypothetical protein